MPRIYRFAAAGVVALLIAGAPAAVADINGGGPDETIAQAYGPLAQGLAYNGAFVRQDDVDYLAVTVAHAGETLEFALRNTTPTCNDPDDQGCPVYATVMDSHDQQVGGPDSDAGTIATYGDSEAFDWTFQSPGTYYVLMESNGDLTPGNPAYAVSIRPPTCAGCGGAGRTHPIVKSLKVAPRQRGNVVRATIVLGQPVKRLRAALTSAGALVARISRRHLAAGRYRLALRLSPTFKTKLQRRHRLSLRLRIRVVSQAGLSRTYVQKVTLRG